ncbi:MAG: glycosyltransferase, partial [Myxococcota bacterium]
MIVPVYNATEATLRCLDTVLASENRTPFELIVIDDASQDARLVRSLEKLSRQGAITLLKNQNNQGFPATANRGMALHPGRDVVLLNSDTLVHGDRLDRLRGCALSDWDVATATPFTNNGEICSYPNICQSLPIPGEEELAELDALASQVNQGLSVTLPTAVGFCTYIRRSALEEIGLFDAERFERGYGEENEFCLRARERGYRNLLAADVFVGHEGGSSFLEAKNELIAQGLEEIRKLYPDYEAEVRRFVASDPVRWLRQRMEIDGLDCKDGGALLMVSHAQGGGTQHHVDQLAGQLETEGVAILLLQPVSSSRVGLFRFGQPQLPNLTFDLRQDFGRLVEVLRLVGLRHVHVHHWLGFDPIVRELPAELGLPFDIT